MSSDHPQRVNDGPAGHDDAPVAARAARDAGDGQAREEQAEKEQVAQAEAADPLEQARVEIGRIKDQLLRTAAELDNFRKRARREIDDAQARGREEMLRELLPVFDNLERAVVHAGQASDPKSVSDGMSIVLRQFIDTLGKMGIRRVATVGRAFDPREHDAIQQIETADHPAGTVVAEVQPGYTMGDRLVRAAMVVVAKPPQAGGDGPGEPEPD